MSASRVTGRSTARAVRMLRTNRMATRKMGITVQATSSLTFPVVCLGSASSCWRYRTMMNAIDTVTTVRTEPQIHMHKFHKLSRSEACGDAALKTLKFMDTVEIDT